MTNTQVNIDELKNCLSDSTIDCNDLLNSAAVKNYLADTSIQAFNIEELRKQEKEKKQAYELHGNTIVAVRKNKKFCVAGDGQVSLGQTIIKGSARKVRRLSTGGSMIDIERVWSLFFGCWCRRVGRCISDHIVG